MKKVIGIALVLLLAASLSLAADQSSGKVLERVNAAANVLQEIMAAPDKGIPEEILGSADCVAIVPSLKNAGFVVGARYGRGIATCRNNGTWSAPAPFVVEGGSWGLQIGGQAIDLVMLVMNQHGMTQLLNSKFKVGADASAAAGPVGRHAEGSTDWKMRSEILTYSRARGVFAGITLNGAVVKQDDDSTQELYGRVIPFKQLLTGNVPPPAGARAFLAEVSRYFHASRTDQSATASRTDNTAAAPNTSTGTAGIVTAPAGSTSSTPSPSTSTTSAPSASGSVSSNLGGTSSAAQSTTGAASTSATTPATSTTTTTTTTTTRNPSAASAPATSTSSTTSSAPDSSTPPATTSADTGTSTSSAPSTASSSSGALESSTAPSTATSTSGLSNSEVKDVIQRALRNEPSLSSSNVNVVVTQTEVQLSGTVPTRDEKDAVRRIAEQNAGSRKVVDNDLGVK